LQAVAVETMAAKSLGVVEGRRILPAGEQIDVVGIMHGMKPEGILVAQVLNIAAGEDTAAQVPVVGFAVHNDRAGSW
jgi:hypothetical protein